ncbi:embryogenesis-associated protein EMB8-like protein, partial [Tanacetum coccineum]
LYATSFTGDVSKAVVHVSSRYPDANLYAAGWSLGANILVKYLGEEGDRCLLSGAVSLHALLFEGIEGEYNIPVARNSKSLREFDESYTRVSFGLKSVDEFYQKLSSSDSI